ncbi:VOC family protein [Streptomyces sp. TP-A0874]|uniref:VOC family protein n=1 Tax=Streptomyces sp. TP-A0874 TaxID=549819 RepID=UPI0008529ADF|nr:VOC family protein [Streptomyces sp. TP-A0874]
MPEITTPYAPGTPCWIDLVAPDQQAAIDFYADLFGWSGEIGPPEMGGYTICRLRDRAVAGITGPIGDETSAKPSWTTYLSDADADATAQAITSHSGTVMLQVTDVSTFGRMLLGADPTGAVFGTWQPLDFPGAGIANEHGSLIWSELVTTDPGRAADFYSTALGLEAEPLADVEGYLTLKVAGRAVGGVRRLESEGLPTDTSHWLPYFAVDDPDSTVDALTKRGGSVLQPPFDMVAGRMALVQDPQGAMFAVIAPKAP